MVPKGVLTELFMRNTKLAFPILVVLIAAADWPQWRGPERNGLSPEKGLLKTWPKSGPQLVWTYENAGTGYSSPAVVKGKVYIPGARKNVEYVIALDGAQEKWAAEIGPIYDFNGNAWSAGPNAAPLVEGDSLYAVGSQGELICVDIANGKDRWRINMPKALSAEVNPVGGDPESKFGWGHSASPLLDGDNIIVTPGGPKGLFAAINKKTGAVVWQSKTVTDKTTYASPVVAEIHGVRQYITIVQNGAVGVSAKDGSLLWEHRLENPYPDVVCGTPIVQGDLVYLSVGYGGGSQLLKLTPANGKFKVASVYAVKEMGNKQGGVVLISGNVYGFHENRPWMCQEFMTGMVKWESTRRGLGAGSLLFADGRLYCLTEDKGEVAMLDAAPTAYKEVSRFTLPKQSPLRKPRGKVWTHPVLADGMLYLRDQELLFCYKVK